MAVGNALNTTIEVLESIDIPNLVDKLQVIIGLVGGLIVIYIIYHIINFFVMRVRGKRIKKTLKNTEEILDKLEEIEKKLGIKQEQSKGKIHRKKEIKQGKSARKPGLSGKKKKKSK